MHNKKGGDAAVKKPFFKRFMAVGLLCALLLVFGAVPAFAANNIISVSPDDDNLFLAMNNLVPGESRTEQFIVKNIGDFECDFYLTAESAAIEDFDHDPGSHQKSIDLLALLDMEVVLYSNGTSQPGTVLYKGKAHHFSTHHTRALIGNRVNLGTLQPGGSVVIEATVEVPSTLDNSFEAAQGKFWWHFSSEGEEPVADPPVNSAPPVVNTSTTPTTGDAFPLLPGFVMLGVSAFAVVFLLLRKRKQPNSNQ
ncbi:hypothetical protein LJC61_03800 [Ruminococcaceae bacterium OttesenSCG-928-A16]|nr:hypothetical protein [Ruminococcaceae bacterium OttesenSCG-928-A16]